MHRAGRPIGSFCRSSADIRRATKQSKVSQMHGNSLKKLPNRKWNGRTRETECLMIADVQENSSTSCFWDYFEILLYFWSQLMPLANRLFSCKIPGLKEELKRPINSNCEAVMEATLKMWTRCGPYTGHVYLRYSCLRLGLVHLAASKGAYLCVCGRQASRRKKASCSINARERETVKERRNIPGGSSVEKIYEDISLCQCRLWYVKYGYYLARGTSLQEVESGLILAVVFVFRCRRRASKCSRALWNITLIDTHRDQCPLLLFASAVTNVQIRCYPFGKWILIYVCLLLL